ncbi:hypothetical protein CBF23_007300 [Marinomonas agarivorans]|nr:hypothetical protein CBF23_007300 [Marinomonas agarivorans]
MKMHRATPAADNRENKRTRLVDNQTAKTQSQHKKVKNTLIAMTVIYACAFPFTIMPAIFSIMLGTNTRTETYIAIFSLMSLPAVLLFSILVPWILYFFQMPKSALLLLFLPFVNGVLILLYVVIGI